MIRITHVVFQNTTITVTVKIYFSLNKLATKMIITYKSIYILAINKIRVKKYADFFLNCLSVT